jgi:hypothetical protein
MLMAEASFFQANGSMSLSLKSKKLVASPSHHHQEMPCRNLTPNTNPTSS